MPKLSITPLGTNGFIPTHGRQTQCYLVRRDDEAFVIDAGTGLGRLLEPELAGALAGLERLDILLTHYHLDHTVGLSYLTAVASSLPVRIHAPAPPLVDGDPDSLGTLINPPFFPIPFAAFPSRIEVVRYDGDAYELAGAKLRLRRQVHAGGSVGLVVDDRLGFATDCEVDPGSAAFFGDCQTLFHEIWVTDEEAAAGAQRTGHSTIEIVAALASAARIGTLLPMHHHPSRSSDELAGMVARLAELTTSRVILPVEGREYVVGE
jgi:ribonuclease BN (tRNA processing enzyme)